jgi:hypothetical protein
MKTNDKTTGRRRFFVEGNKCGAVKDMNDVILLFPKRISYIIYIMIPGKSNILNSAAFLLVG